MVDNLGSVTMMKVNILVMGLRFMVLHVLSVIVSELNFLKSFENLRAYVWTPVRYVLYYGTYFNNALKLSVLIPSI